MISNIPQPIRKNQEEEEVFESPFVPRDVVTLISSDNEHYVIPRQTAEQCKIFASAFQPGALFKESCSHEMQLDFNSELCEEIIRFLFHKQQGQPKESFVVPDHLILDLYALSDFLGV